MFAYLEGTIIYKKANYIILKTKDGVGYKIHIISNFQFPISNKIPKSKSQITKLYIYHYIREDKQELYGFSKPEDLEIFEILVSISGVGPKTALLITSQYSSKEIKKAIETDNISFFQSVKGLGKKTAAKIILELKGKLLPDIQTISSPQDQDAIDALISLGYKKQDIIKIISRVPSKYKTTEEKIKWILKNMGK